MVARRGEASRGTVRRSEASEPEAKGKEEGKVRRGSVGGAVRPWEAVVRPRGGAATTRRYTARARQTDWHWHRGSRRQWSSLVTGSRSRKEISRVRVSRTCALCILSIASRTKCALLRASLSILDRSSEGKSRTNGRIRFERIEFDRLTVQLGVDFCVDTLDSENEKSIGVERSGKYRGRTNICC